MALSVPDRPRGAVAVQPASRSPPASPRSWIVLLYPFMKRVFWLPQIVLGLCFAWGGLMGWAAIHGSLSAAPLFLYAGAIAWVVGYDTIYALAGHRGRRDRRHQVVGALFRRQGAPRRRRLLRDRGAGDRREVSRLPAQKTSPGSASSPSRRISPSRSERSTDTTAPARSGSSARTAPPAFSSPRASLPRPFCEPPDPARNRTPARLLSLRVSTRERQR